MFGRETSVIGGFLKLSPQKRPKLPKMIPNGYLIFEDESFLDSTVAKMNALRKSGQFCDVRLQVGLGQTHLRRQPTLGFSLKGSFFFFGLDPDPACF